MSRSQREAPAIGIDIGGTKLAGGLVDAGGRISHRTQAATPEDTAGIVAAIARLAAELLETAGVLCEVCE